MTYLIAASLVWSFSFGLIKHELTGLDFNFVAWVRLTLSFAVFLPFVRLRKVGRRLRVRLLLLGVVQYGLMYMSYIYSYRFLAAYEVAVFTIFTPVYVTLINDLFKRRFHRMFLLTALLSVVGTAVIVCSGSGIRGATVGILILQFSNMCFAFGQVWYRMIMDKAEGVRDRDVFGIMYLGAACFTLLACGATTPWLELHLTATHMWTLLYLGVVPSGIGFFLWNVGARKTNAGTLAVLNNAKIPLAVLCSLVVFGEHANMARLLVGGLIIAVAVFVNEKCRR